MPSLFEEKNYLFNIIAIDPHLFRLKQIGFYLDQSNIRNYFSTFFYENLQNTPPYNPPKVAWSSLPLFLWDEGGGGGGGVMPVYEPLVAPEWLSFTRPEASTLPPPTPPTGPQGWIYNSLQPRPIPRYKLLFFSPHFFLLPDRMNYIYFL